QRPARGRHGPRDDRRRGGGLLPRAGAGPRAAADPRALVEVTEDPRQRIAHDAPRGPSSHRHQRASAPLAPTCTCTLSEPGPLSSPPVSVTLPPVNFSRWETSRHVEDDVTSRHQPGTSDGTSTAASGLIVTCCVSTNTGTTRDTRCRALAAASADASSVTSLISTYRSCKP